MAPFAVWEQKTRLAGQVRPWVTEPQDGCCRGGQAGWGRPAVHNEAPVEALGKKKNVTTQICLPKRTVED